MRRSFAFCSSIESTLPSTVDEKPHCGKRHNCSNGTYFIASSPKNQLFTGKDLIFPIEQDNSNIRHYLVRFRRRTKVISKCPKMVDLSLWLHHHLREPENYADLAAVFLSIFT
jgi:hypothetical protein